ncbi:MAG: DUF2087 domain-containing protein [Clostridia bacterium]
MDIQAEIRHFLTPEGKLTQCPSKRKKQICIAFYLAGKLDAEKTYTEPELNDAINAWTIFRDPATLRRDMVDLGLVTRENNGRAYALIPGEPNLERIDDLVK